MNLAVQSGNPTDIGAVVKECTPLLSPSAPGSNMKYGVDDNGSKPLLKVVRKWKKPVGKPKRPLSAYNMFFQLERDRIVDGAALNEIVSYSEDQVAKVRIIPTHKMPKRRERKKHGMIAFADLARLIGQKWKKLDDESRSYFEDRAKIEKTRYDLELKVWRSGAEPSNIGVHKTNEGKLANCGKTELSRVATNVTLEESLRLTYPERYYDDDSIDKNLYTLDQRPGSFDYDAEENPFDRTAVLSHDELYPDFAEPHLEGDYEFHEIHDTGTNQRMNFTPGVVSVKDIALTRLGVQKQRSSSLNNLQHLHPYRISTEDDIDLSTGTKSDRTAGTHSTTQNDVQRFTDRVLSGSPLPRRVSLDDTICFPHLDSIGSSRRLSYPPQLQSNNKVLRRASIGYKCASPPTIRQTSVYGGARSQQLQQMRMIRSGSLPIISHQNNCSNTNSNIGSNGLSSHLKRVMVNNHVQQQRMLHDRQLHQQFLNARRKSIMMRRRQLQALKFYSQLDVSGRGNGDAGRLSRYTDEVHDNVEDDVSLLDFSVNEDDLEFTDDIVVNNTFNGYSNDTSFDGSILEPTPFDHHGTLLNSKKQPSNDETYIPSNYKSDDVNTMYFADDNQI